MADTSLATTHGLSVTQWEDQIFAEYLDRLIFAGYMGTSANDVFHVKENLLKSPGDTIVIGLRGKLDNAAVEGTSTLEGNEEALEFHNQSVVIDLFRNGVRIDGVMSNQRAAFDIREEAKAALVDWMSQEVEDRIAAEFSSINGVAYASATEPQKDAWLAANADRVLFGASTANNSGPNDHSASLTNIDATNDILTPSQISLAKRLARLGNPKIRPMKLVGGVEIYVMFVHPYCFRDLLGDSAIQNAQREVYPRMGDLHPLTGGQAALWWDGVLIVESEKIRVTADVGAGGTVDVAHNVLCGAQALMIAQGGFENGSRVKMVEEEFDYAAKTGFALSTIMGFEKARFDYPTVGGSTKDHGIVTVYSAAEPD